jgi:hypothetical protein
VIASVESPISRSTDLRILHESSYSAELIYLAMSMAIH